MRGATPRSLAEAGPVTQAVRNKHTRRLDLTDIDLTGDGCRAYLYLESQIQTRLFDLAVFAFGQTADHAADAGSP